MERILLLEDDKSLVTGLTLALGRAGYALDTARTLAEAGHLWQAGRYDLLMLDVTLPDGTGFDFCREVRRTSGVPILFLTASDEEMDIITGLDLGGDDYITKPFSTGELLARVRAALRLNRYSAMHGGNAPAGEFRAQGMRINYDRRKVFVEGEEVKLTQTEYNIVAFLSQHAGRVMTYAAIVKAIWGDTDIGSTKKLQVNMANIRKKLGSRPGSNSYILNELGVGYRMLDEDSSPRSEGLE